MSQDENELPPPTKKTSSVGITPKTSAVPLKKETVRITLRANAPGVDAPSATVPLVPRPGPPAPSAPLSPPPRPSAGAPTAPGVPPRPAPPVAPAGSKTIPLAAAPPRATVPALARPAAAAISTPAAAAVGTTQSLARTPARLPAASPSMAVSSAPIRSVSMSDDDAEVDDGPLNIMALVALVASLAMLFFAIASVDAWPLSEGVADTQSKKDEWVKNEIPSSFKLPLDHSPFDKKVGDMVKDEYESKAPVIPARPGADGQ